MAPIPVVISVVPFLVTTPGAAIRFAAAVIGPFPASTSAITFAIVTGAAMLASGIVARILAGVVDPIPVRPAFPIIGAGMWIPVGVSFAVAHSGADWLKVVWTFLEQPVWRVTARGR